MNIYITRDGESYGPFSPDMCFTALMDGHLQNHDLAWHEGLDQWYPLHAILGKKVLKTISPANPRPTIQVFEYSDPKCTTRVDGL